MTPEEKAEKNRLAAVEQLEKPTLASFDFLMASCLPVTEEAEADLICSMDELEILLAKNQHTAYGPRLGELLLEAGFQRKMVMKKNTLRMAWLFKNRGKN